MCFSTLKKDKLFLKKIDSFPRNALHTYKRGRWKNTPKNRGNSLCKYSSHIYIYIYSKYGVRPCLKNLSIKLCLLTWQTLGWMNKKKERKKTLYSFNPPVSFENKERNEINGKKVIKMHLDKFFFIATSWRRRWHIQQHAFVWLTIFFDTPRSMWFRDKPRPFVWLTIQKISTPKSRRS